MLAIPSKPSSDCGLELHRFRRAARFGDLTLDVTADAEASDLFE